MKKLIFIGLLTMFGCKTAERITFPLNSENKVEYTRQINFGSLKKEEIYDKIIKWVAVKYQEKEIKQQNKADGIISVLARTKYLYKGKEMTMGYKLIFLIENEMCNAVITNINIRNGRALEFYYADYSKDPEKKTERNNVGLSNTFASIDDVLSNVLNNIQYDIK